MRFQSENTKCVIKTNSGHEEVIIIIVSGQNALPAN